MELEVKLLARDFGGGHPVRGIAHLIFGEVPGAFGQFGCDKVFQDIQAIAGLRTHHQHIGELDLRGQPFDMNEQLFLHRNIDLVEDENFGFWA